ncbi:MAG: hypothetical protein IPJ33_14905 [Gammaproteobacteria bacterium]|nr:hypothetical protein [Gammaproteobacteria bacterium]
MHGFTRPRPNSNCVAIPASTREKQTPLLTGNYFRDPQFSPAERAVLEFTEIYAQDPAAISDDLADAVKEHFGETGLMCLIEALGFIDGRIRLALIFSTLHTAGTPAHGALS